MRTWRGLVFLLIAVVVIGSVALLSVPATPQSAPVVSLAAPGVGLPLALASNPTNTPRPVSPNIPAMFITSTPESVVNSTATLVARSASELQTPVLQTATSPVSTEFKNWNPPAVSVPVAHDPRDHYWFIRPVAANNTNSALAFYPYGSDGPQNDLRIHHGIDLPNPIGVEVVAAGDGTVVMAQKGFVNEYENISSYGNVIVIDHDFGYSGQHLYTLYAHLSAILVQKGDHVHSGQLIGLIGNTGQVSGPHVHFEVRVGRDTYNSVRNPVLWMAPYVGTGVIAGRIAFVDRAVVNDAVVTLIDQATGNVVARTTTYAGSSVNADDEWKENFVFPDVAVGRYLVTATYDTATWSGTLDVIPGATNWVEFERYSSGSLQVAPTSTP